MKTINSVFNTEFSRLSFTYDYALKGNMAAALDKMRVTIYGTPDAGTGRELILVTVKGWTFEVTREDGELTITSPWISNEVGAPNKISSSESSLKVREWFKSFTKKAIKA